jgi:hypothetical protein
VHAASPITRPRRVTSEARRESVMTNPPRRLVVESQALDDRRRTPRRADALAARAARSARSAHPQIRSLIP